MKHQIKLNGLTTLSDIEQWPLPTNQMNVAFVVKRSAEFEPGAEGLALAYVGKLLSNEATMQIDCEFTKDHYRDQLNSTILCSAFGYTLIRSCKVLRCLDCSDGSTSDLRTIAGTIYDQSNGVVGLGNHVSLIAFDPKRPWPRRLVSNPDMLDQKGNPLPSSFEAELKNILSQMGMVSVGSRSTITSLVNFVFELFSNTLQHGRPSNPAIGKHSTRGVTLSKIIYNVSDLHGRGYSAPLLAYLERNADLQKKDKGLFVFCISVMDMGDGIQNTLPPESIDEEPGTRLIRAFSMGESRRSSDLIARGAGLQRVLDAAHTLGARLQVRSAGLQAVKDFSLGHDKLPDIRGAEQLRLSPAFSCGTSIDIFFARPEKDFDQRTLIR